MAPTSVTSLLALQLQDQSEEPAGRRALRLEPQGSCHPEQVAGWGPRCMGAPPPMGLLRRSLDSAHRGRTCGPLDTQGTTCPGWHPKRHVSPPSCLEATGPLFPTVRLLSALLSPAILDAPSKVLHQPSFSGGVSCPCLDHPGILIKVGSGCGGGVSSLLCLVSSRWWIPLSHGPSNVMHTPFPQEHPHPDPEKAKSGVLETPS